MLIVHDLMGDRVWKVAGDEAPDRQSPEWREIVGRFAPSGDNGDLWLVQAEAAFIDILSAMIADAEAIGDEDVAKIYRATLAKIVVAEAAR